MGIKNHSRPVFDLGGTFIFLWWIMCLCASYFLFSCARVRDEPLDDDAADAEETEPTEDEEGSIIDPSVDAGETMDIVSADTFRPTPDTGLIDRPVLPTDRGQVVADTGFPIFDTGFPIRDTGFPILDTGFPVVDTGFPVVDAPAPEQLLIAAVPLDFRGGWCPDPSQLNIVIYDFTGFAIDWPTANYRGVLLDSRWSGMVFVDVRCGSVPFVPRPTDVGRTARQMGFWYASVEGRSPRLADQLDRAIICPKIVPAGQYALAIAVDEGFIGRCL